MIARESAPAARIAAASITDSPERAGRARRLTIARIVRSASVAGSRVPSFIAATIDDIQFVNRYSPVVTGGTAWSFLTNHGQVLILLAEDPDIRLRDLGDAVGITERAAHRIVTDLTAAGYVTRTRNGRRNRYSVRYDLPLPDPLARGQKVGDLLEVLTGAS